MMIENYDFGKACIQLNVILGNLPTEERNKIPKKILTEINKYKSNKYKFSYDYSKPLKEQELLPLTQQLLYYVYTNYLNNHNIQSYSNYDIFNNNDNNIKLTEKKETDISRSEKVQKKSFFKTLISKITNLFNKK